MTREVNKPMFRRVAAGATAAAAAALLSAVPASAQSALTNSASFNGGWGRIQGTENAGIDVRTRDENGNRIIVDGILQDGSDNSEFVQTDAWGNTGVGGSGVGYGRRTGASSTAIGNNLQVITQGNWNTVIVNSTQINNGDVTANSNATSKGSDPNG